MAAPAHPVAPAGTGPFANRKATVQAAAAKWHVPFWMLYGVWGRETSFGTNVATSPAGAQGDFQFIPSTARAYNYPLTNTPTGDKFAQQADAAAHYLHDLLGQHHGNADAALRAYSGGGYGQAEVQAKSREAPDPHAPPTASALGVPGVGAAVGAANAIGDAASLPGKLFDLLTSAQTWIRVVEIVAGVALLLMALKSFTGGTVDPVGAARRMVPVL